MTPAEAKAFYLNPDNWPELVCFVPYADEKRAADAAKHKRLREALEIMKAGQS